MNRASYLLILLFTTANAAEFLLMKASGLNVYLVGIIMFATSGVLLSWVLLIKHRKIFISSSFPHSLIILIGVISILVNVLWFKGLELTSPTHVALLGKSDVIFSLLISMFLLKESIGKKNSLFILLMVVGMLGVMKIQLSDFSSFNPGDVFIILSAALLAFNAFLIRKAMKSTGPFEIAFVNCVFNTIGFAFLFFLNKGYLYSFDQKGITIAIIAGVVAFLFFAGYYPSIRIFPLYTVRVLALLTPIITVIGDVFFLKKTC